MEDMDMRSAFDFTPYRHSWIGFDHLFDMLENTRQGEANGFPPFDLEQHGENVYRLRLAVAGFSRDDIEITAKSNLLTISGHRTDDAERTWLYRGIAAGKFERQFQLADYVVVTGARLSDGLLEVDFERQIPDEVRPRRIEIATEAKRVEDTQGRRRARSEAGARSASQKREIIDSEAKPAGETDRKEKSLTGAW
jgi:molecular chaperone IbpA